MKANKFIIIFFVLGVGLLLSCDKDQDSNSIPKEQVKQARSSKRGVCIEAKGVSENNYLQYLTTLIPGISWSYNWGPDQYPAIDELQKKYNLDFCPMAWNGNFDSSRIRAYKAAHPECEYLLAFNEPNLKDQANMTPAQAAQRWPELKSLAKELGLKIISPAMNYGTVAGYSDPIVWLDEFFKLVSIDDIDGISIHCYMSYATVTKGYIERFKKYNKPLWMTEICAWDPAPKNIEQQMKYLSDIINYMECDPDIVKYAWFLAKGKEKAAPFMSLLTEKTPVQLSDLGKIFVHMSTQDKPAFYIEDQIIEAEHYNSICISENVGNNDYWIEGPSLKPSTDEAGGTLDLFNFQKNQWVEYQLNISQNKTYTLTIRYNAMVDSELNVEQNGNVIASFTLPNSNGETIWETTSTKIALSKGKQIIRLKPGKGSLNLNWIKISGS